MKRFYSTCTAGVLTALLVPGFASAADPLETDSTRINEGQNTTTTTTGGEGTQQRSTTGQNRTTVQPHNKDQFKVGDQSKTRSQSATAEPNKESLQRAQDLLSAKVTNDQGEEVGQLEEIVVDFNDGRIGYIVLSTGGFLGIGENYHAIPFSKFDFQKKQGENQGVNVTVQGVTKEQLSNADGFDKNNWPNMAERRWRDKVHQDFDAQPYWEYRHDSSQMNRSGTSGTQGSATSRSGTSGATGVSDPAGQTNTDLNDRTRLGQTDDSSRLDSNRIGDTQTGQQNRIGQQGQAGQQGQQNQAINMDRDNNWVNRLSEMMGTTVKDMNGEDVGKLQDLVIDTREGRVVYMTIERDGDRSAIAPWSAVRADRQNESLTLRADSQKLDQFAFEGNQLPDLSDKNYADRMHQEFGQEPYWEVYGYSGAGQDSSLDSQNRVTPGQDSNLDNRNRTLPGQDDTNLNRDRLDTNREDVNTDRNRLDTNRGNLDSNRTDTDTSRNRLDTLETDNSDLSDDSSSLDE